MESPNRQAAKLLREQRKRKKRIAAFLCMAGVVVVGTVMALRMSGRAMNNMALDCVLTHDLPHQHSEACYYTPPEEGAQQVLVCGMADFVVHKHDPEACFDKSGNLVCMLPEIEEHTHTEECYQERQVLSCGMQEGEGGHVHSDSCYGPDRSAEPICGIEENEGHTHGEGCYDAEGQLICELAESEGHTHDGSCYPEVLVCGLEDGEGGHIHSDACYSTEAILACGKNEVHLHTHTEECYLHTVDQPDQLQAQELAEIGIDVSQMAFNSSGEAPEESNRVLSENGMPVLKCGQEQVVEHVHGDDCYISVGPEGSMIAGLESGGADAEMPGQRTAVYQDPSIRATAIYNGADFPENARVGVERVDESEGLPGKQEELSGMLQDEELQLKALLKVTVSMPDGNYELSEPVRLIVEPAGEGEVTAAAWYDSSASGGEQTFFTQSVKSAPELLEVTALEEGGVEAGVVPGAVIGIAQRPVQEDSGHVNSGDNNSSSDKNDDIDSDRPESTEKPAAVTVVSISQDFGYEDEDYSMVFHIDGIARPKTGAAVDVGQPEEDTPEDVVPESTPEPAEPTAEPEDESGTEESETGASETDTEPGADDGSDGEELYFSAQAQPEDDAAESSAAEPEGTEEPEPTQAPEPEPAPSAWPEEETAGTATVTIAGGDVLPANVLDDPEHPLGLKVERVPEESAVYEMYSDYAREEDEENGLPGLKVMSYTLYYKGMEMDISQCDVTLDVTVKDGLIEAAEELEKKQSSLAAEDADVPSVAMLTLVPVEEIEEEAAADEEVYSMPATASILNQVDEETKLLDIANENRSNSAVVADAAIVLSDPEKPKTVRSVLRTASKTRAVDDSVSKDHFGLTAQTADNPHFTVQYYALLDVVNKHGSDLAVIDTTGGKLPKNGSGEKTSPNGNALMGLNLNNKKVETSKEWHEIYTEVNSYYIQRPNLKYFAPVEAEKFYNLKQIWVLNEDGDAESEDIAANWTVYGSSFDNVTVTKANEVDDFKHFHFTNRDPSGIESDNPQDRYVRIEDGSVIRLIYEPSSGDKPVDANFYDYDITDGTASGKTEGTVGTSNYGINKYNGAVEYDSTGTRYAFGNNNAGTKYGDISWGDYTLNMANTASYGKCTFDIVKGIDANGNVIFNSGINGPTLFGSGEQNGRTMYSDSGLTFTRYGDTYTLTSARVGANTISNLDMFTSRFFHKWTRQMDHTQKCNDPDCRVTGSNNFWPMDKCWNADLHFGTKPDSQMFKKGSDDAAALPKNDDIDDEGTVDHNSYFGMNFSVVFDLTTEYTGPLEYLFFGDDDMWVFLTQVEVDDKGNPIKNLGESRLICDIGGVHSSVGEYVNLWDYVGGDKTKFEDNPNYVTTKDDTEEHGIAHYRLDFFYTERGASGSTCWMQYTLPSVRSATDVQTEDMLRQLEIKKEVTKTAVSGEFGTGEPEQYDESNDEFLFKLTLKDKDGNKLTDSYSYIKYDADGQPYEKEVGGGTFVENLLNPEIVYNGAYFTLKHGEYIKIDHLPAGTLFTIEECGVYSGYKVTDKGEIEFIFKKGEHDYETGATIKQGNGESVPMHETSEGSKIFSGQVIDNVSASVLFDNNFKTFELPETGGTGTWMFTGAGALMLLAAGCLVMRKRTNKN